MKAYTVTVTVKRVVDLEAMDPDDRQDPFLVDGGSKIYVVEARNAHAAQEKALDEFHGIVPIGCLDDFEIDSAATPAD